ncbi:salicylate carboxymethyltransferase-like isoform X2 [Solanum pennellii]|uniref:Salicylate carboxymethyltransferase-like isoform X2 n=1 Tax=Solanum pennellii TaxID=28526 RepID=A0ABM1V883_SOLPN|nr:salicylate carboxymethyltransferase-like isoform X2 [Solanum pennellii]
MEVTKVLHMNKGMGDASYAKNSLLQQKVILMTKSITDEAISSLYNNLSSRETICIADLGCSSGPNTFLSVSQFIQTIDKERKKKGRHKSPEFHVFLNDLPSNDFNTIFQLLPTFHQSLRKQNMGEDGLLFDPSNCFVTGVAGSFYTRLFPSNSLHFVHSSYSLHWLSQVPDGIKNNKGNIYLTSTSPTSVHKAYYEQFERDFVTFLKYRSEELMKNGRMVLTMLGRKNEDRFSQGCSYEWELLATTLKLLIAQQKVILMTKSITDEAISSLYNNLSSRETIRIADLGVAGSFYTRLFPSNSLHFVHSSYSLHWLSQVPDGIKNNKGNIYLTSTSPTSVHKAYYEQFERDFVTFLKYRSEELMKNGRMVLTMLGRKNEDRFSQGCSYEWELLATTLKLLIAQESIDEEKVNSFNIPLYNPSPSEVMYIVEKERFFTIDILKTSEIQRNSCDDEKYDMAKSFRSVAEPLLVSHFGHDELNMDQVIHKYNQVIANDRKAMEKIMFVNVTVSLTNIN